ncbi:hypothetical protein SDC9_135185 [bioreactor metagenome]|uniref:Uncharacterized protein n=1 Tax=bioreactor metagenome TaxID=1076179 RepID=A0A645DF53_9ZZZZ
MKSIVRVSGPSFMRSKRSRLKSMAIGPLRPKCVIERSPNRSSRFLPSIHAVIETFFRSSPCAAKIPDSRMRMGAIDGLGSTIVCPSFLANRYPSPVDPVRGYAAPPVARMTAPTGSPLLARTILRTLPVSSAIERSRTSSPNRNCTPPSCAYRTSASRMSEAERDSGKTRFPRSTTEGTPLASKNARM